MSPLPPLLLRGDCIEQLRRIPDASVDAVVTDPPYALEFMGKGWDKFTPLEFEMWCESWAAECLRILQPGGHLLAFGGTRTYHRLAAGIEDAGFEIRDSLAWLYGSGFPKSMDVSKAIDKAAGAERNGGGREWSGGARSGGVMGNGEGTTTRTIYDEPSTDAAREWQGWGTALKPAFEPVVVARKPLIGTVAANVLAHGTGALNIDASRIGTTDNLNGGAYYHRDDGKSTNVVYGEYGKLPGQYEQPAGRWPANVLLDESQAAALDAQSGTLKTGGNVRTRNADASRAVLGTFNGQPDRPGDSGDASRFFYVAKAPKSERPVVDGTAHPTVKPLAVMRWLIRLVTPEGGTVVDPFAGSGTTLEAAYLEGMESIGIELTPDYWPLVEARIARVIDKPVD